MARKKVDGKECNSEEEEYSKESLERGKRKVQRKAMGEEKKDEKEFYE